MQPPPIQYADVGGNRIAYQRIGNGSTTLVFASNWSANIDTMWFVDEWAAFVERLAPSFDLLIYDQRGTGSSDRSSISTTIEEAEADLRGLLDHLQLDRVVLCAMDMSTSMALSFAADHPDRVQAIVLFGPTVRVMADGDYDAGIPASMKDAVTELVVTGWGDPESAYQRAAIPGEDRPHVRAAVARIQRQAVSPSDIRPVVASWLEMDGRPYVEKVTTPTLIFHLAGDSLIPVSQGRWLAEHLPDARYVELPGAGHYVWVEDPATVRRHLFEFLSGEAPSEQATHLGAVVVTDIVDSTGFAARVGHEQWRQLLDRHDGIIRRLLHRHDGTESGTAGDSYVAAFPSAAGALEFVLAAEEDLAGSGLVLRGGVHVGEIEERDAHLHGLSIHIAARVQALAEPGTVAVTGTVRDCVVGNRRFDFSPLGPHELRGVPGEWPLFRAARA